MKIGVVCESEERLAFFRSLVKDHNVFRISPGDPGHENFSGFDGVLFDGSSLKAQPDLIGVFQSLGFVFGAHEDHLPCVIRHGDGGRLQLQCGRQAAAKLRAATGKPPSGTQTLVFQHSE